jgi:linoleoyl-CoA desaturase
MIFQPAHVVETSAFYQSRTDGIQDSWLIHQLRTTTNFGVKSKLLFWFSGGLNHQIEHHLFPNVCHIHYKHISNIVKTTSAEYGLPYHTEATLGTAIGSHLKMLKALGSGRV